MGSAELAAENTAEVIPLLLPEFDRCEGNQLEKVRLDSLSPASEPSDVDP